MNIIKSIFVNTYYQCIYGKLYSEKKNIFIKHLKKSNKKKYKKKIQINIQGKCE